MRKMTALGKINLQNLLRVSVGGVRKLVQSHKVLLFPKQRSDHKKPNAG